MESKNNGLRAAAACAVLLAAQSAWAVEVRLVGLEERVRQSDLVGVIRITSRMPYVENENEDYFRVEAVTTTVLKGKIKKSSMIEIRVDNTIHESRNDCCVAGASYIGFLKSNKKDGQFVPVASPLGLIQLEP